MFSVLGRAAVLIGFTLVVKEAGEAVQNLYTVRADSSKLVGDLEHLAATGKIAGETLRVFGADLDGLAKGVENIGSRGWMDKFNEALNTMDTGAEASRKRVHELDAAFAEMATNGNPDGAAAAFDRVTEKLLAQGLSIEEILAAFPEYAAAQGRAAEAAALASEAAEAERAVIESLGAEIGETTLKTEEQTEAQKMLQKVYELRLGRRSRGSRTPWMPTGPLWKPTPKVLG
jgi:methyl-accepting chemotaxis protein